MSAPLPPIGHPDLEPLPPTLEDLQAQQEADWYRIQAQAREERYLSDPDYDDPPF